MDSKNFSRRNFIQKGALAGIATTTMVGNGFSRSNDIAISDKGKRDNHDYPSSATRKLTDLLNIRYPIVQAPTGGVVNSSFTAAVANNGGLGELPLSWSEPDYAEKQIAAVKEKTNKSFFANFVLNFEPKAFDTAIKKGVPIIQFSWGMPTKDMVAKMKAAKVILGIQVTSGASAKVALGLGADYLVCQGTEAGAMYMRPGRWRKPWSGY